MNDCMQAAHDTCGILPAINLKLRVQSLDPSSLIVVYSAKRIDGRCNWSLLVHYSRRCCLACLAFRCPAACLVASMAILGSYA